MNSKKLIKELKNSWRVRCKYWSTCSNSSCGHYEPHTSWQSCLYNNPVKYCMGAGGFVYDIPYTGNYAEDECDPNLAFKAKRDAQRRHGGDL
jgi:hypothetical protein